MTLLGNGIFYIQQLHIFITLLFQLAGSVIFIELTEMMTLVDMLAIFLVSVPLRTVCLQRYC